MCHGPLLPLAAGLSVGLGPFSLGPLLGDDDTKPIRSAPTPFQTHPDFDWCKFLDLAAIDDVCGGGAAPAPADGDGDDDMDASANTTVHGPHVSSSSQKPTVNKDFLDLCDLLQTDDDDDNDVPSGQQQG